MGLWGRDPGRSQEPRVLGVQVPLDSWLAFSKPHISHLEKADENSSYHVGLLGNEIGPLAKHLGQSLALSK